MRSSDGSVYQGMYHSNKRHGHGCISYGYVVVVVVVVVIISTTTRNTSGNVQGRPKNGPFLKVCNSCI